jgi:hypothetical protein
MSISFPEINDPAWRHFAENCAVVAPSGSGGAIPQLQEAANARNDPARLFIPVQNNQNQFRRFEFAAKDGTKLTIIGTWFNGGAKALQDIVRRAAAAPAEQKGEILKETQGKVVYLAAAHDATGKSITGLRLISDDQTAYALININPHEKLGHPLARARLNVSETVKYADGIDNPLSKLTSPIAVRPSREFTHMFEDAAGLCLKHG